MSSSKSRSRRPDTIRSSVDEFDSVIDSEDPSSPVVRIQKLVQGPTAAKSAPPPLPPKPAFARAAALPHAPPPLPPKPDNVRADKLQDLSPRPRPNPRNSLELFLEGTEHSASIQVTNYIQPPTRPLPAVPKLDHKPPNGESESWLQSNLDERSQIDPPLPPDPTITSDGEPIRIPVTRDPDSSTHSPSDNVPKLTVPLPPPPYSVQDHRLSCIFQPLHSTDDRKEQLSEKFLSLSLESAEDANIGAIVLGRERSGGDLTIPKPRAAPVQWRPYTNQESGGEVWSVLHEYLTNDALKAHGRNRALLLLTGYVVGACLQSHEAGYGLLTEIVRRMRGAERSERDGSIFTLLMNIAAHTSFVQGDSWSAVEEVARKVFSDVVEEMHGRQDDDVMWERALRCFLMLLEASDCHPSEQFSSKCLAALALHIGDMTHTDVDHVLVTEGLCWRLRNSRGNYVAADEIDVVGLEEIGGLETIHTIYADSASPSARSSIFGILYDVAVLKCLEGLPREDVAILQNHVVMLRAMFEAYEMCDLMAHVFRIGPWEGFVMDVIRVMLFDPLTRDSVNRITGRSNEESQNGAKKAFQEKEESTSFSETRYSGTLGRVYESSASKYLSSIRVLVRLLDKPFCLKVISQLATLARQHARKLSERETMHFPREWKIIRDIESQVMMYRFSRNPSSVKEVGSLLTKIYVAVVDITSGHSNMRSILQMTEIVIDFFLVKTPFTKAEHMRHSGSVESKALLFLKGHLMVAHELLHQANPSIFSLLLLATKSRALVRRFSENRQALIEFLGTSVDRSRLLETFNDDDDPAVAYRASELISRYSDQSVNPDD